jgi:hypothetical protein
LWLRRWANHWASQLIHQPKKPIAASVGGREFEKGCGTTAGIGLPVLKENRVRRREQSASSIAIL